MAGGRGRMNRDKLVGRLHNDTGMVNDMLFRLKLNLVRFFAFPRDGGIAPVKLFPSQ